jgi:hypothetical protein
MPKPIAEVVVSGHSADVVSGWLSGSKRAKPEVADEPTEDFQPRASRSRPFLRRLRAIWSTD